jgi:hypothetical protein
MSFFRLQAGAALAAVIILTGCTNTVPPASQPPAPADCGAAALQDQVGELVQGSTAADVTVGGAPVQSRGIVRVYATGQPVTQDYNESRLNLETDAAGNLVNATCG